VTNPWGRSGPGFEWLYIVGVVVGLAVAIGVRMAARRSQRAEPHGPLAPEALGFLAGGSQHAVQVAVARLVQSDLVRVDRSGTLTATANTQRTGRPLDRAVLAELTTRRKLATVAKELAGRPVVTKIGEALVRRGLLIEPRRAVQARLYGPVVLYLVFVVGLVRWINGIINDRPTGHLPLLLAVTLVAILLLSQRIVGGLQARTVHGDRVVAEVRARGQAADPLKQVAVSGLLAYPDKELSKALTDGAAVAFVGGTWRWFRPRY
jgi:uncharacterized protein (TIGR04222 family)